MRDRVGWHQAYADTASPRACGCDVSGGTLSRAIDEALAGRVRLVSLCAGQGHDVIGGLENHPRRGAVTAALMEAETPNAETARRRAASAVLD